MELRQLMVTAFLVSAVGIGFEAYAAPVGDKVVNSSAELGPEYKEIHIFPEFRKKLLADGWEAEKNPDCHDAVKGALYDELCSKDPCDISCRLCTITPELFRMTSDGYLLMKYKKSGVSLGVTLYGDTRDFDHPGEYGLSIVGWDYEAGMNVQLLD